MATLYLPAAAQTPKKAAGAVLKPIPRTAPAAPKPAAAPGRATPPAAGSKPGPTARKYEAAPGKEPSITPKQLEEALRKLLRADSVQNRKFRPTEIEGLIVDQTITKVGHDFYDVFYTHWEAPAGATDFTVTLRERPARGTATLVTLEVNDTELLEMPLQPKFDVVEAAAQEAVAVAQDFLIRSQTVKNQLDGADQSGSGLF
ncbi:CsgE family curli-type amyloid fiber assembly protein [Hymenobacter gummosus]|uniref:CsgE family curli-type amyloid fiber assembly protein n=1 Tax=Hymenobacter gummosus TaxID=1776032 RepID=UPI001404B3C0|nr:CsgE family curli-type amyloid fiber assembly protein [Hymenobacter gummosus]